MIDLLIMEQHYRVKHTQSEFAKKPYQWDRKFLGSYAKHGLSKFKGIREFLSALKGM